MGMTTVRSGSPLRVMVTDCVAPSATVYDACPKLTVTEGTSSSVMLTVVSAGVPALSPPGSLSKPMTTLSPSSSIASSVALTVKICSRSSGPKVTLAGTPE